MKIGICSTDPVQIKLSQAVGYDFVEVNNTKLSTLSDTEFDELMKIKNNSPAGFFYACNGLIPSDIRLTGEDVDFGAVRDFSRESFKRLDALGVKMLVFGSSKSKNVPQGFPYEEAMKQLVKIVSVFAKEAEPYGMKICIEPLNRAECNIINTAAEAVALAQKVGLSNVGGHADYFHMSENGEDMQSLVLLAGDIFHTHIASSVSRTVMSPDDGADYASFFKALREGGYDKTVSFEGRGGKEEAQLRTMLEYIRRLSDA